MAGEALTNPRGGSPRRAFVPAFVFALVGCAGDPIWHDDDQHVSVRRYASDGSHYTFERDADELSHEQVKLLRAIQTIGGDGCVEDSPGYSITVTDVHGHEHEYFANTDDASCNDDDDDIVDYDAVKALLRTTSCSSSDAGYSTLDTAHVIGVGDGCHHGLVNLIASATPFEWWFRIKVVEPATLRIAIEGCGRDELQLSVLDPKGNEEIASAAGTGKPCAAIEHRFGSAGSYPLHIQGAGSFLVVDAVPDGD